MFPLSAQFFVSAMIVTIMLHVILAAVAYSVMLERKIAAWIQNRIGPNRVGFDFGQDFMPKFHFWGLGQPLADGLKLLLKEDYSPPGVEKKLFYLAPALAVITAMIGWAIIPWAGMWDFPGLTLAGMEIVKPGIVQMTAAPINLGILFLLAVGSLAVYGIVLGGFASNNKYSFLGSLRATAQMLSYEIPMGIIILIVVLMSGGYFNTTLLVTAQQDSLFGWNILWMPLLAIIFFTCQLAEANRTPFDLAECEQELVGGFHTEYSSMKFALYFLAEYMHVITASAIFVLLFLGGSDIPFITEPTYASAGLQGLLLVLLQFGVFAVKTFLVVSLIMVIRWTIPRFRFDQLMRLAWTTLIPITLLLLVVAAVILFLHVIKVPGFEWVMPWMLAANILTFVGMVTFGKWLPKGPKTNRKVRLEGSRFSAPLPEQPTDPLATT